jgi:hypothetical protein
MRRRSLVVTILILVAAVGSAGGVLAGLLKHEPAFYTARNDGGYDDPSVGARVLTKFGDLKNDIRSKAEWGATFSTEELNAFFQMTLGEDGGLAAVLPDGLSDPRIIIDGNRILMAARYGKGTWSTVLSLELRGWLVKGETNTVALEIVGMWAGGLPLGTQSMLDSISETARDSNVVATWYRNEGHPVGVFRFYADQARPTTQIRRFKIEEGRLTVMGRSMLDTNAPAPVVGQPETE